MTLVQAATMATVAGETVKPGRFQVPKICDIPARFPFWQIFIAGLNARFCGKIGLFGIPVLPARAVRLTASLPLPEAGLTRCCGKNFWVPENTGAGHGRRDGLNPVPTRNRAGWNAMKRGIGF
jgi:hypothetical protein